MKTALYAGTMDPITNGHLWMIKEASDLFDNVVVVVTDNPSKRGKTMFDEHERIKMAKDATSNLPNVKVVGSSDKMAPEFTVKLAKYMGAGYLVRGIRNVDDFSNEQAIRHVNEDIFPEVKTVFMVPPRNISEISSSMVKGLVGFDGWLPVVQKYVPACVVRRFQAKSLGIEEVLCRLGLDRKSARNAAGVLDRIYSSPTRYYHNQEHIDSCLDILRWNVVDMDVLPEDFDAMAAALWFHDAVYVAGDSCNESASAELFRKLTMGMEIATVDLVRAMIIGTKDHSWVGCIKENMQLVNDIDMSILASTPSHFLRYEWGIRKEYADVPDDVFYPARKKLLSKWLSEGVFSTPLFKLKYHDYMVANITELLGSKEYSKA